MACRFLSTDWLAEYCCFALDNGAVVEICTDSQETLDTEKGKVDGLFKKHRGTSVSFSPDFPRSTELPRTKRSRGGTYNSYSTIMRNPKSMDNWPVHHIKFNSAGWIMTWYVGSWVGFCNGELVDGLFETTITGATPEDAYAYISRLAETGYSLWYD